ncbi:MAG: energy transducer TonB [Bacteroidota bacterium]
MKSFINCFILLLPILATAQKSDTTNLNSFFIFINNEWEKAPETTIPPSTEEFEKILRKGLTYPTTAARMGVEGDNYFQLTISKDGALKEYVVKSDIGAGTETYLAGLSSRLPQKWNPAQLNGENVASSFLIQITYELTRNENSEKEITIENEVFKCFIVTAYPKLVIRTPKEIIQGKAQLPKNKSDQKKPKRKNRND